MALLYLAPSYESESITLFLRLLKSRLIIKVTLKLLFG